MSTQLGLLPPAGCLRISRVASSRLVTFPAPCPQPPGDISSRPVALWPGQDTSPDLGPAPGRHSFPRRGWPQPQQAGARTRSADWSIGGRTSPLFGLGLLDTPTGSMLTSLSAHSPSVPKLNMSLSSAPRAGMLPAPTEARGIGKRFTGRRKAKRSSQTPLWDRLWHTFPLAPNPHLED